MDVVDGFAPFVLTMTLEYSPDDTESLLGFKPQLVIAEIAKSLPSNMLIEAVAVNKS